MGNGSVFCRTLQYNQGTPGLFNRLHRLLQLPFIVLLHYARQCAKYFTWIVSFNSHNNLMRYAIHPLLQICELWLRRINSAAQSHRINDHESQGLESGSQPES